MRYETRTVEVQDVVRIGGSQAAISYTVQPCPVDHAERADS